jgi:hypothetical protein
MSRDGVAARVQHVPDQCMTEEEEVQLTSKSTVVRQSSATQLAAILELIVKTTSDRGSC